MEGITRREAGRRAGIDESTVRKHLKAGALDKAVLADGSLHPEKVLKLLSEVVQRGPRTPTYLTTAKTRRARAQVAKLSDEVSTLRASALHAEDVDRLYLEQALPVAKAFASVPWDAGTIVAGKPAEVAFRSLRDLIAGAFRRASDADAEILFKEDGEPEPEPDLSTLSPQRACRAALSPAGRENGNRDLNWPGHDAPHRRSRPGVRGAQWRGQVHAECPPEPSRSSGPDRLARRVRGYGLGRSQ